MLLPYLDQAALFQSIDFNTAFRMGENANIRNTVVPMFHCPSDPGIERMTGAGNNYVVSGGPSLMMLSPIPGYGIGGSPGIPILERDQVGMFNMRKTIRPADLIDGMSQTVAMSEGIAGDGQRETFSRGDLVRAVPFPSDFPNTFATSQQLNTFGARCLDNKSLHYSDPHREWLNGMPAQTAFNTLNPPNSPNPDCHENSANGWYDSRGIWSARSLHHGGVNTLMADGACRMISDNINVLTWQQLGAIADGQVPGEF